MCPPYCSEIYPTIDVSIVIGLIYGLFCLVSIGYTYVSIFNIVLRMPSIQGQSKAFSTCLPHLTVVTTFLITGATAYLKHIPDSPHLVDFLVSVFYAVLPPFLNPVIYSLRNKEIKTALGNVVWQLYHYRFYEKNNRTTTQKD